MFDALHATVDDFRQKYPVAPDIRFVLDHMHEDQTLDEGTYLVLNLFAPRAPLMAIMDGAPPRPAEDLQHELAPFLPKADFRGRASITPALFTLAEDVLSELPRQVQGGIANASLHWLRNDLHGLAEVYATWTHEDETVGGALKPFLKGTDRRIKRNGDVCPRTARRIRSPAYIARVVKTQKESQQRRIMATRLLDRAVRAGELSDAFTEFSSQFAAQREAQRQAAFRHIGSGRTSKVINVRAKRRQRSVIKRAVALVSRVMPDSDVRTLVRGEPVKIAGQAYDLSVQLATSAGALGHGTVNVQAIAHDGNALASLCVYHEKMPALDQVAALALAMRAGEEADIIRDANIIETFPAGHDHPLLVAKKAQSLADAIVAFDRRDATLIEHRGNGSFTVGGEVRWSHEEQRARECAYWNETKHIWLERLAVFACGRRVKILAQP